MTKNETKTFLQLQQYNIRLCIIPRNYVSFSIRRPWWMENSLTFA